jgi:plastocyanin
MALGTHRTNKGEHALRRITWILAPGLAVLALAAAGCGGSDNGGGGDGTGSSATSTPSSATSTPSSSGGAGETLAVTADPSGAISWDKTSLSAKPGKVTLKLVNKSSTPHAIEIEGNGVEDKTETITGGQGEVTVDLKAGDYEYYCPVGQHRQTMKGTLTVK